DLFGVPSSSQSVASMAACSAARAPTRAFAMSSFTWRTAFVTPLPPHSAPPSRSSVASNSPVEAPDGTAARPRAPESSATSTSTVGLPRESRIWRPWMRSMTGKGPGFCQRPPRRRSRGGAGSAPLPRPARGGGEAPRRRAQGELRVHPRAPRLVHEREQRLADPPLLGLARAAGRRPRLGGGRQARRGRAALQLARVEQGGEVLGDVLERVAGSPPLLLALDPVPVAEHLAGRARLGVAEDVGVAADQLRDHGLGHLAEAAGAALLEQEGEEEDLEEHVAQLVEELRVVARSGRVGQLVRLFHRVGDDRALVLLAVPGALAAQAPRDLVQPAKRGHGLAALASRRLRGLAHFPAAGPVSRPAAALPAARAGSGPSRGSPTARRSGPAAGRSASRTPRRGRWAWSRA